MVTPAEIRIHLALHHHMQPAQIVRTHAMVAGTLADHIVYIVRVPACGPLEAHAATITDEQVRVVVPARQQQRGAVHLRLEAVGGVGGVAHMVEQPAEVVGVADDVGCLEHIFAAGHRTVLGDGQLGRVGDGPRHGLNGAQQGLEMVRVLRVAPRQRGVVAVVGDLEGAS